MQKQEENARSTPEGGLGHIKNTSETHIYVIYMYFFHVFEHLVGKGLSRERG